MTKKLKISIGPHRHQLQIAHVNDSAHPTIINSDLFVGRVLVKIRDFEGITPDGSPPIRHHVYFDGRSRRFDIQIEGRFKHRPGVPLYTGEEIHFGSDFDHFVEFPRSAFNAGMRVARWIDPNTFYEFSPASGRPFIMSPYLACMNTLCAWPAPSRMSDALVCLRQSSRAEDCPSDEGEDMVPMEQVDQADLGTVGNKKIGRHPKRYWRFIGLRADGGRIDAFLEKNKALLAERPPVSVPQPSHPREPSGDQPNQDDTPNGDDDEDALSCRAPSSHATYSTALENRPPLSSASSHHFSTRPFPRHQVSFGAGMRDRYQDEEAEAQDREGVAHAQQVMDRMGHEDLAMCPPMPPQAPRHKSNESSEESKKSHGVKHRLRKLKTAFQKLTPNGLSSSTSSSSLGPITLSGSPPTNHSKFTTALHQAKQPKHQPSQATVTRVASRTLPFTRRHRPAPATQTNSSTSTATSTATRVVKPVMRSATLASRPLSQPPAAALVSVAHKFRSTSFDQDQNRSVRESGQDPDFSSQSSAEKLVCVRASSPSLRVASPSIYQHSDETGSISTTSIEPQSLKQQQLPVSHSSSLTMRGTDALATSAADRLSVPSSEPSHSNTSDTDVSASSAHTSTPSLPPDSTSDSSPVQHSRATQQPSKEDIENAPELCDVEKGDLMFADMLNVPEDAHADEVSGELGPWRFRNPTTDILEDNTFVFLNQSVDVQKRRKYFSESYGKHRKTFTYDPDVVYATSFFSPFMNFNTFDLAIGPVKANVAKFIDKMPIRYTLRSTRVPEGSTTAEEEVFVTIAFELVDE